MTVMTKKRCARRLTLAGALLATSLVSAPTAWAAPPKSVAASYTVSFAGVSVGTFKFNSTINGDAYTVKGDAELKALFGALKWLGDITASGKVTSTGPRPASYNQKFISTRKFLTKMKKKEAIAKLRFASGKVAKAELIPPLKTHKRVPLKPEHRVGVIDPAAAILALSQDNGTAKPCERTLKIFDGRQRLDLILTTKGEEKLKLSDKSTAVGFVCGIVFRPIAGHKSDDEDSIALAKSTKIEIVLRRVPSINALITQEVRVPTLAGTGRLSASAINVIKSDGTKVALPH